MCMSDSKRIESKDVPKYAYKVYESIDLDILDGRLSTYFQHAKHEKNNFNKSNVNKKTHKTIRMFPSALHLGRISVYVNKKDAVSFRKNRNIAYNGSGFQCQVWKVEIKQTTKYAYKGKFTGDTLAVDQVKPVKRVI